MPKKPRPYSTSQRPIEPPQQGFVAEPLAIFSNEISVSATVAQNEFGRMLTNVAQGRVVVINRHNEPSAVLISSDRYRELTQGASKQLELLTHQFDALFARMQSPPVLRAMQSAFDSSPEALAKIGKTPKRSSRRK